MRATLPALAVLTLALTACDGCSDSPGPADTTASSPPSSPVASATASPSPTPATAPTPEPAKAAPAAPVPEPVPTAPVAPAAAPLPDPASLTPGEHCAPHAPVSSDEEQLGNGIAQVFIGPVTGAYIERAPPAPPTSPGDADPDDPRTWQGVDENGNDWAVTGPPPPGV